MKKIISVTAIFILITTVFAEVIEIKSLKDWAQGSGVRVSEQNIWDIIGSRDISNSKSFKVIPDKKYTLSFEVRKSAETQKVLLYVGFWPLDMDMVRINPHNARCEKNSETVLTSNAAKGSKSIRINQPKRWKKGAKLWCVSFNDRKNCSNLDMNVICNHSSGEQAADGSIEVKLKSPLTNDYKENTPVHFHSEGPGMYSICQEKVLNTEWEKVSGTITGIQKIVGVPKNNQWWPGSKYGKLRFLIITSGPKSKVQLRNIKLTIE